jgi:putative MATE family efflux protein
MTTDLTQGPIPKHLRQLAIPAAIGFFFHTMFNVTDTYFAGKVSTDALAALSLTFPVFFMIIAVGSGMAQGVTAIVGNALGAKDYDRSRQVVLHTFIVAAFLSIVLSTIGISLAPLLMEKLGATGNYLDESLNYILTLLFAAFFFIFSFFTNALLNSAGDFKSFRNILALAFVLNIFLDYWFVYGGFGLEPKGVKGIAMATVTTEGISMFYLIYRLRKSVLFHDMPKFVFDMNIIKEMIKQGTPPTINLLLMAAGVFLITFFASAYGRDAVAGLGVGMRIEQMALMPALGISMSVLSLVAQNNGAQAYARIEDTLKTAIKYAFIICLIGATFLALEAEFFVRFFTQDSNVIIEAVLYAQIAAIALFGYIIIFTYLSLLQGIQRPAMLLYISLARQIVLPIAIFSLLAMYNLPIITMWIALTAIVWSSALFLIWYGKRSLKDVI